MLDSACVAHAVSSTYSENAIFYRLFIQINLIIVATGDFAKSLAQGGVHAFERGSHIH